MTIEFEAPIRVESEMNRREHWTKRRARFAAQKRDVFFSWPVEASCGHVPPRGRCAECVTPPVVVTLTRIGPRKLDSDNLSGGFKGIRDQIADLLSLDDGDERIEWRYAQEKGKPKEYAIRVRIEGWDGT